tara:strand:+ start:252 stop:413 length:162 start_codon:yes stop_codon:yes gene_type:complete
MQIVISRKENEEKRMADDYLAVKSRRQEAICLGYRREIDMYNRFDRDFEKLKN